MEAVEFGKANNRKIVLIPGNMMSWRQFENVIPLLARDYHVIAVSTDGYSNLTILFQMVKRVDAVSLSKG